MKKIKQYALLILTGLTIISCNKREIIPAPERKIDLKNHFVATIDNSDVTLTQNVNGYTGKSDVSLVVYPDVVDSAIYQSEFFSEQTLQYIKVMHGSILFDASTTNKPSIAYFNSFYPNNMDPEFMNAGKNGFAVEYRDVHGKVWSTRTQNHAGPLFANYTWMDIQSDAQGDYVLFKVNFSVTLYRDEYNALLDQTTELSLNITDATYTGWYKR